MENTAECENSCPGPDTPQVTNSKTDGGGEPRPGRTRARPPRGCYSEHDPVALNSLLLSCSLFFLFKTREVLGTDF